MAFLSLARAAGLEVGRAAGFAVVPVLFSDLEGTLSASERLLGAGFYAPPIAHVGVPKNAPRIRFFISSEHERRDMAEAINVLGRASSVADGRHSATAMAAAQ